ncbi:MAG: SDR family NAD(P)-dependent oxidoreductase [Lachnospiraceae bacterium]
MLSEKVAIITGATKGIGKATTQLFSDSNAIVYGIGRDKEQLSLLSSISPNINPIQADVCDVSTMREIIMSIQKNHGHIDILVNNAGIMKDALLGMISEEMIQEMFQTNVFSTIQLTQFVARIMKRQKSGSIINISSIVGVNGNAGQCVYSATKGAIISFTKSAAKELANNGIRVNAIAPGIINTDLISNIPEQKLNDHIAKIKIGRIGEPEDIAKTALFLASDLSSYITGQIIGVDGMTIL